LLIHWVPLEEMANGHALHNENGLWPSSILNVKLFEGSLHEGHALHSESGL